MRKITEDMSYAFWSFRPAKRDNTEVFHNNDGEICMKLHNTVIARISKTTGELVLNNGDYYTVTTKERLNGVLRHINLSITQKQGNWRVYDKRGDSVPFVNGMRVKI
jgi:hypothetical protein